MRCNRIVFGAHLGNMARGGVPGDQHVAYYADRLTGCAGTIVVEPMPVHPAVVLTRGNYRPGDNSVKATTESSRCVAIQQLYHVGAHGDSATRHLCFLRGR
ncbi:TIM barrel domain-containing protein (plasmid) [Rhizobium phaseoli]|nr:TIM barrel domain-containing protein [Rhizobium phaseoli]ANL82378.1 TIM barrel domain-containing protein [Rhizobium phaseoli]